MVWVVLALVGCGEDRQVPAGGAPAIEETASCLEDGGAVALESEKEDEYESVVAGSPLGDAVVVFNLPRRSYIERAARLMRKEMKKQGLGGILVTTAVNRGFTLVGVIGREDVHGGMPYVGSEALAKLCATRPPPKRG